MQLGVAGISFKTAEVDVRERLSFQESDLPEAYRQLLAKEEIKECVILSTCNRVEIYAVLNAESASILKKFIRDYHKYNGDLQNEVYTKVGAEALRHLCMVTSGLDSMVLGESQIFGQVKDSYTKANQFGAVRYTLEHIFAQVFSIVKKIRAKTGIGEKNLSVSYAAVQLARSAFTQIEGKKVMILGAGEMGKLTVRNLIDAGISGVVVANRTFHKAVEIAEKFHGIPIMLHEVNEYLSQIDIVISSISCPEYAVTYNMVNQFRELQKGRSLFLVDISVPRSIDPEIKNIDNIFLYNIDNLKAVVDSNIKARQKEALKAQNLIEKKLPQLMIYLQTCDLIPTLVSIRSKAEEIRKNGIEQAIRNLSITNQQKDLIDNITRGIVNKILHLSEMKIKEYSAGGECKNN